jgi:hypothetical protein
MRYALSILSSTVQTGVSSRAFGVKSISSKKKFFLLTYFTFFIGRSTLLLASASFRERLAREFAGIATVVQNCAVLSASVQYLSKEERSSWICDLGFRAQLLVVVFF